MKVFAYILVLIAVTQIALPCCLGSSCAEEEREISYDHGEAHHSEEGGADRCTSLCCGILFTLKKNVVDIAKPPLERNHMYSFTYQFQYHFDFLENIWQPPRAV